MPKFAVYYVPEESSELYQLGSAVLGYDVRKRTSIPTLETLRSVPHFTDVWLKKAGHYGFHLTISDSIDFDTGQMNRIKNEVADVLNCFDPAHSFTLHRRRDDFVTAWGPALVLRYDPNDYLKILHAVIAARIHPLGTGSGYLQRYLANPEKEPKFYRSRRIRKFFSPTIFDSYSPHFTLLNPYTGESKDELTQLFSDTFGGFHEIVIRSIALLLQPASNENWQIHQEFEWAPNGWK
jgi:hypothetical protein